jgi:cobaltochelatase CobS
MSQEIKTVILDELKDAFVIVESGDAIKKKSAKQIVLNPWDMQPLSDAQDEADFVENDLYVTLLQLFQNGSNVMITGPAGCGKSYSPKIAARTLGMPFFRINMTGHSTDESLVGNWRVVPDPTSRQPVMQFFPGILIKAMRTGLDEDGNVVGKPAVLLIDEIDAATPETLFTLQRVLEPEKTLTLDIDEGKVIKAHPGFVICATANTIGSGDLSGAYSGTNIMNFATRDRFNYVLNVDYNDAMEMKVLVNLAEKTHSVTDTIGNGTGTIQIGKFLAFIHDMCVRLRELYKEGVLTLPITLRRKMSWLKGALMFNDAAQAFRLSIYGFVDPEQQPLVAEAYQRIFGVDITEINGNDAVSEDTSEDDE